jgi:FMN phosphatase YigB (HAD superfamily)
VRILKAAGLTVGVAGNTGASTEAVLRDTGLGFDIIGSSRGWAASKPAPAFFEHMVQVAGLPPAAIAYVGDRLDNDVLPATQAGLRAGFSAAGSLGRGSPASSTAGGGGRRDRLAVGAAGGARRGSERTRTIGP